MSAGGLRASFWPGPPPVPLPLQPISARGLRVQSPMNDDTVVNLEQAPEDIPSIGIGASVGPKRRRSLSKSRRELTEAELGQSGVRLMLLDEVDRLDAEVSRLLEFQEKYYAADKMAGLLTEKHRHDIAVDVAYGVCVSFGVGFVMLAATLPKGPTWPIIAAGIVLTMCGIAVKVIKR